MLLSYMLRTYSVFDLPENLLFLHIHYAWGTLHTKWVLTCIIAWKNWDLHQQKTGEIKSNNGLTCNTNTHARAHTRMHTFTTHYSRVHKHTRARTCRLLYCINYFFKFSVYSLQFLCVRVTDFLLICIHSLYAVCVRDF